MKIAPPIGIGFNVTYLLMEISIEIQMRFDLNLNNKIIFKKISFSEKIFLLWRQAVWNCRSI